MKKFLAREILIGAGVLGALILEYLVLSALFGYDVSDQYLGLSLRIIYDTGVRDQAPIYGD